MKLIKTNKSQLSESKEVLRLLRCQVEYELKGAKGELHYRGPKLAPEMWHQVMSFFRWTDQEMRSESQVRLYVNITAGRWGAWAFPQLGRTGMSARELPIQETANQAQDRFASWNSEPSDDWLYFGTVHHHCSASAFQSSTDEQNEWNQDGLHLTVGRIDADRHELHARLYLGGNCFEPDLSLFWPIDPELAARVPPAMLDPLARFQMCEKIVVDFPGQWRANIIEVATEKRLELPDPLWGKDEWGFGSPVKQALEELSHRCAVSSIKEEQCLNALKSLSTNDLNRLIIQTCLRHGISPDELLLEILEPMFG